LTKSIAMPDQVVIVSRARTPIGSFQGALSAYSAPKLGSIAIKAALERAKLQPSDVNEVIMGEVLTAGVGQAPARQAAIGAGIPTSVPCLTVNKVCGSGLKAVMLARDAIRLGEANIVVAGGMESMTNAPYLLPTARRGMRMGNQSAVDSMILDGLWDPYGNAHMGCFGDLCAKEYKLSRQEQDAYAMASYERARTAQKAGHFEHEMVVVDDVKEDEEPSRYMPGKIPNLRPAFDKEGTVTAANSSKINDGAAALVVMSSLEAKKRGIKPLVEIISTGTFAQDPSWFTTAPIGAIKSALVKANLQANQIDLFEINEAFAAVSMVVTKELGLSAERVNVWGGAIALGHPIGCSGARILATAVRRCAWVAAKRLR
jgi:acetyl-CoA C-acetyltransferase